MSILGKLGKVLSFAGGIAGAPFTGGASLIPTILSGAGAVAPILGGMAKNRGAAQDVNDQQTLRNRELELKAPGMRIANAAKAHLLSAGPSSASWGGPGSGLRGETVKYSGGASSGFNPADKSMMDDLVHQQLQEALTGENLPQPGRSSTMDKIIGGGATAAGLLGALGKLKRPGQQDNLPPDGVL